MQFYDRVPRLLFPFSLMQLFCRKTSSKSESTSSCHLLSMWVKSPFLSITSSERHTIIDQAPSVETWNLVLSSRWPLPLAVNSASQFADYTAQKHRQKPSEFGDACEYLEYSKYNAVAEHKEQYKYLHETTKASSLYLPPHPFISLDAERHIFRDS